MNINKENFKKFTQDFNIPVFILHRNGGFIHVNSLMEELTGYGKREILNFNFRDIIHPEFRIPAQNFLSKINSEEEIRQNFEMKILDKKKEFKWVEVTNTKVGLNGDSYILGTAIDITERKETEYRLKIEKAYLDNLFNNSPEAIVVTTNEGIIKSVNNEFTELFGYSEKESIGQHVDKLLAPPNQSAEASDKTKKVAGGNRISSESVRKCKDGRLINVSILGAPIHVEEKQVAVYGIYRDITKRIEYERHIKKAKEKAEEADYLKSAFLANMSHEIRTPMNAILGFSRLMKEKGTSEKHKNEYLDIIYERGEHLLQIINDIIDLSKIEAGQIDIQEEEFDLNKFLNQVYTVTQEQIHQSGKNIELYLKKEFKAANALVYADKTRIQQIISNLLSNAIKYTNNGYIEFGYNLKTVSEKKYLEFFVKDTGIGIEEDKHGIIFERFRQSDESKSRDYGGTGLGLSITKALVDKMKGKIWLSSQPGNGSIFYFRIPYKNKKQGKTVVKDKNQDQTSMDYNWKDKRILIVEDDMLSIKFLEAILEDTGAEILFAKRGSEAIDIVSKSDLDLVLMDIQLPGMNGNEATAKIREINKDVPVIAQTAHAMSEDKKKSMDAGCDDYITKPIDVEMLLKKIEQQFNK